MKRWLGKAYWVLVAQLGIDPRKTLAALWRLPRYLRDWRRFRAGYPGPLEMLPCLHDRDEHSGATQGEYFLQDLLVARMIHAAGPARHVDVGSRVDGFVAHVASFREIEVFDVRPPPAAVPGIVFRQADLMSPVPGMEACCDSLSCLHALEHFGLGRYGDPLDPQGHERGLAAMARLLQPGGTLYLSVPIGAARVVFNAHRVFDPRAVIAMAAAHALAPASLDVIEADGTVRREELAGLADLAGRSYSLGLFVFRKLPRL